jgi:hypothetical protein
MKVQIVPIADLSTLQTLLLQQVGAVRGRVQVVEAGFNTDWGPLLLGIDQDENRLVVFLTAVTQDENLLSRLIGVYGWALKNQPLLSRLYAKPESGGTRLPRMIAVAPGFPKSVQEGLGYLNFGVELYLYRGLEIEGEPRILLEPVAGPPAGFSPEKEGNPAPSFIKPAPLSDAEIRFFETRRSPGPMA